MILLRPQLKPLHYTEKLVDLLPSDGLSQYFVKAGFNKLFVATSQALRTFDMTTRCILSSSTCRTDMTALSTVGTLVRLSVGSGEHEVVYEDSPAMICSLYGSLMVWGRSMVLRE